MLGFLISNLVFVAALIVYLFFLNEANRRKAADDPDGRRRWIRRSRYLLIVWIVAFVAMIYSVFQPG